MTITGAERPPGSYASDLPIMGRRGFCCLLCLPASDSDREGQAIWRALPGMPDGGAFSKPVNIFEMGRT